ncbi:camp-binding domain-like protein [Rhizoclosmatium globosum]|uniref:Camp-binding domain-like protein n=1 Tax=Rhizoclosmatium globosum TaxID=329046 RepID=A0A1Y2CNP3_9FUNG|nr:camp-binding domain-like protein [Rhizoclosmatium globosum]|eukprot:ORY48597.1 camp-binding domain-like protein [Rhizoclosmatium globosum]
MTEQVIATLFIIVGASIYAAFLGSISSAAMSLNPSGRLYNQKMEELLDYVEWKKLDEETKDKLISYYEIKYRGKYFEEDSLLSDMNESLRADISLHNTRFLIEKVPFLRREENDGRDEIFFYRLATVLHAHYFIPGDYVTKQGDSGHDMYFILSGKVNVFINGVKVVSLYDGAYIGGMVSTYDKKPTATVQAAMPTVMYRLTHKDFHVVISDFPDMKLRVQKLAMEGQKMVKEAEQNRSNFAKPTAHLQIYQIMEEVKKSQVSIQAEQKYNKRVKEENRLQNQRDLLRRNKVVAFVSSWQDNAIAISIKTELKKIKECTMDEIELANRELMVLRRRDISELLEQDKQVYKAELEKMNLAFHEDRI